MTGLGHPRMHLRVTDSTNVRARELAVAGAPHGTLVTAAEQTAGRGRQGRSWTAPAGHALLMSLVLRDPPTLLALTAGVAVARTATRLDAAGREARVKWPNDVLLDGRKAAGILVEARPQARWAVLGVGLNVAVAVDDLGPELATRATGLGGRPDDVEAALGVVLEELERALGTARDEILSALRQRDALRGQPVRWARGRGIGAGIDDDGRLIVRRGGETVALDAGEVHLLAPSAAR